MPFSFSFADMKHGLCIPTDFINHSAFMVHESFSTYGPNKQFYIGVKSLNVGSPMSWADFQPNLLYLHNFCWLNYCYSSA